MCKIRNMFKMKKKENFLYVYNIQDILLLLNADIDVKNECKSSS